VSKELTPAAVDCRPDLLSELEYEAQAEHGTAQRRAVVSQRSWAGEMKSNWQVVAEPLGGAESCLPYLAEEPGRSRRTAVELGSEAPTVDTGGAQHRLGPGSWVGEMKRAGGWGMVSARAFFAGVETGLSCAPAGFRVRRGSEATAGRWRRLS
jgi:hypothetical protein